MEVAGLDLQVDAVPLPNLTLSAGVQYLDKYEFTDGPDDGLEVPWAAEWSGNLAATLVFPLADLPQLARGKGNKIIGIPGARVQSREEFVVAIQVLGEGESLVVYAGKRHLSLKFSELEHYRGERGRRGNKLPRGFQKVDSMQVDR